MPSLVIVVSAILVLSCRQTDTQTDRHTDRQTHRQTDTQTDRQTDTDGRLTPETVIR